jgi:hypothetical protein
VHRSPSAPPPACWALGWRRKSRVPPDQRRRGRAHAGLSESDGRRAQN